ncbi:MAG: 2-dehydropantoate 2-reductase [Rhodobacter sp.]|nr:2-dehydropantoate 2-reductase [Paracoccaceae bacterium]MCC0077244.1 2-dehydropantoate 2-reductase [Rhodobacter sp.]
MKITILGAGATGGHFALRLAQAGHEVSVIARGATLEAIRARGLQMRVGDSLHTVPVRAEADAGVLGAQDLVLVGVKATQLGGVVDSLAPLCGPDTQVIFPQNGLPWWYGVGIDGDRLPATWPGRALAPRFLRVLAPEQLIGGSIYSANQLDAPGLIRNSSPELNRLDLGSVVPGGGDRVAPIRSVFAAAGIEAPEVADIRAVIWRKLFANMCGSLVALITGSPSSVNRRDPMLAALYHRSVGEALRIAAAHGYDLHASTDPVAMLARIPEHKPSILQDYEAGRPMEIGQIALAPLAFAQVAGVDVPILSTICALATRLAEDRGLYVPEEG